jgi:DCN1-like protein 1/2
MKSKLTEWRKELKSTTRFKNFYNYVFEYLREDKKIICKWLLSDDTDKCLTNYFSSPHLTAVEEAKTVWEMLKMNDRWIYFRRFVEFVESKTKAVSRDTWRMLLNFIEQHPNDLSKYDADACWPSLIDEFVELIRSEKNVQQ